jgi:surface protein
MDHMFYRATNFNQPLNNWNTSNVQYMTYMFAGTSSARNSFDQDISMWNVSEVTHTTGYEPDGFSSYTPATWTTAEKPNWN